MGPVRDIPKLRLVGGRQGQRARNPEQTGSDPQLEPEVAVARQRREQPSQFDDLTDAQLVSLVMDGDRAAFEALYKRHSAYTLGLAVRIQGSAGDVEDIVHDAFLRAHGNLTSLKDPSAFRAWLGSIVVRLVRTRLRRRRLLGSLGLISPEPVDLDAVAAPDADTESRVLLAQIYALLQTLPASDRIAWTLRFIERHRLESVAELMECSLATAKRRIQRAQRFLSGHFVTPFSKEDR